MKYKFPILKHLIAAAVFALLLASITPVHADDSTPSATDSSAVNYQLAFPGILPDNPLYFLKAARDRVIAFFISNPIKKSEFDLLQADKRVEASNLLSQNGKIALAETTFSKAENYFDDAIVRANDAKKQGVNIKEVANNLTNANRKHQQVLDDMKKKFSKNDKQKFSKDQQRLRELEKRVNLLSHQQ